jgi:hypothetical protein
MPTVASTDAQSVEHVGCPMGNAVYLRVDTAGGSSALGKEFTPGINFLLGADRLLAQKWG